jgi:acyl carrier protein
MNTVRERIARLLSQVLHEPVDPARDLRREDSVRWDSLGHLRIVLALEEEFGVAISPDDMVAIQSLSDLERLAGRGRGT